MGNRLPRDIKSLITATNGSLRTLAGPSHAYAAAAGQVPDGFGGVQVNTIPPVHSAGYYGGPAYTNLFAGGPTGVEAEVLTAQKYCLQCVGGSVDAGAYGTATPSAPLIFTASAASQNFTPSGCTAWMLSAAGGYVFPIIPPGQSVVSTVGTTGGNGIQVSLTGSDAANRLIECFRGVPDGTEVWSDATASGTNWAKVGSTWTHTAGSTVALTDAAKVVIGQRYLAKYVVTRTAGSVVAKAGSTGTGGATIAAAGTYAEELTCAGSTDMAFVPSSDFAGSVTITSIQKLNPAVGTVGVLMKMGASASETINDTQTNFIDVTGGPWAVLYQYKLATPSISRRSYDLSTLCSFGIAPHDRNENHIFIVEFGAGKYRVGNKRYTEAGAAIDANIVWSHATLAGGATFDGSFNPTTFLRWFLNSTVPNWMRVMMVSNLAGLGDTELLRRFKEYGKF